ncbi:MAG: hypothetical protein H0X03_02095 [Nitrosopumilus sp.]|nr:hypothetical protein [Nitrosopumilus sp.]
MQKCCCNSIHINKIKTNIDFTFLLFQNIKKVFIAALGIEILCIISAEIGENIGLYIFGFNIPGIAVSYALGFSLAGFSTFMAILGRYDFNNNSTGKITVDGCCSFLEENADKGFLFNMFSTFLNFKRGFKQFINKRKDPGMKNIIKGSITILITAESACILTAETVVLILYNYSALLAVPLALIIGTFTLATVESYRKVKNKNNDSSCQCNASDSPLTPAVSSFVSLFDFKRK